MSRISSKTSGTRMQHYRKKGMLKTEERRLKPFGFCCSMDTFDPLTRYDQRMPPYNSSPTKITSTHECPLSKLQIEFFTPRQIRERRKLTRIKTSTTGNQLLRNSGLNYFQSYSNNGLVKWYLEDEIALAKDIFWVERQRHYNEMKDRAIKIAEEKRKSDISYLKYPRWYQDFSPKQMKNLMSLEDTMHADYEESVTSGTQTTLIAIGIISTFFKFRPSIIRQLQTSCNLDSVCFLREVYKILTGNDFQEEEYKKFYDCNERIILSAIAFLTLPEAVMELHRRLPKVIMPRLPPKPISPICLLRRKSSCPYKEELFKPLDWAGYRNDLQRWQKEHKLFPIPKIILPLKEYGRSFIGFEVPSEFSKKKKKDISVDHLEETNTKELPQIFEQQGARSVVQRTEYKYENITSEENLYTKKSETFDIQHLPEENKKFDFTITGLGEKSTTEYKICGMLKPPGAGKKSWLGGKEPHYIIAGASENPPSCSVTYEITGVADVTPTNSDERFFAVLKLGDGPKNIFPKGREHLSRNWQEWLFNVDEEFKRLQKEANELIKSVRAATRLVFPEPVCDNCCSCRQTARTREKLRQTKTPYLLIDNVLKDKDEVKYIAGSMVLHSPAPSPTGSEINLLEMVASQDEIKTNIIINGVTDENGKTQYYISGVQKEKIHVPSRILDPPVRQITSLKPRNVPPCACAIRQMFKKDVNSSESNDDIPWTKQEGLCMGKKYRPDEPGAYSCKMYPGDKSCRRNPFKGMIKIKEEEEEKEGTGAIEMKEPTQALEEKAPEKKRFIPDPDYPAYDDPWNIARIAPSAKELVTDYEKSLKLTAPSLPTISSPSKTQKRQKDISPSSKLLKKLNKDTAVKEIDQKDSIISKSLKMSAKRAQGKRNSKKKHAQDVNGKKKNVQVPFEKTVVDARDLKLSNKVSKFRTMNKAKKQRPIASSVDKLAKQQLANKVRKSTFVKRDKKEIVMNGADQIDGRKREMERLKTMMKTHKGILGDVQPAVLPWEQPFSAEAKEKFIDTSVDEKENRRTSKEPCGWRTKSEQELPAKKTLVYLCEPDYPLETVAVRPGGRPCRCRENRNKKKILMYNVSGLVDKKKYGRSRKTEERTKLEDENRIIDGVTYFTPPVSPRRSDEYVPEYDLLESPYDTCVGNAADENPELLEEHFRPKSPAEKIQKKPESCNCSNRADRAVVTKKGVNEKKEIEEARQKLMEAKSSEERLKTALKDAALMEYFTQPEYDASCRTSHKRNKRNVKLKMVKPVCECKYERKIVERNEERAKWKARQRKLKAQKKQPFMHIVDTSRPIVPDTKFIISDIKRIPLEDEYADEVKYCITGVAENLIMSPPQQIVDGLKMCTPVVTPEPSKEDFQRDTPHRHWSPMDIPPGPLPRKDAALKEEMDRRKRIRDEAFRMIYREDEQDASRARYRDCPETCDRKKSKNIVENDSKPEEINMNEGQQTPEALMKSSLSSAKKTNGKIRRGQNVSSNNIPMISREKMKHPEETAAAGSQQQDAPYKQTIEKMEKNDDETHRVNDDKKYPTDKLDLMTIVKAELKKMAVEGYVFAKLPECYLMPQLQTCIMYRKGIAFSKVDKEALMRLTISIWKQLDAISQPKIELPSLHMTQRQLRELTYDRAEEIKKKIEKEMKIFYSKICKSRVSYAQSSWGSMEFGKFPSVWFKRAFFTYMASKEAD